MMNFLYNVWVNALFETRILLRSWFFRVVMISLLVMLFFMNLGLFSGFGFVPWFLHALHVSIPYANFFNLNLIQVALAAFLATDFLKRERKMDSMEVIYIRSMSNLEYILGKSAGTLFVFAIVNFLVMVIALVYHLAFSDLEFNIIPYFLFIVLVNLPSLIFIIGFSYIIMVLFRNQAVAIITIFAYLGTLLFYIQDKFYYIFDFLCFYRPLMYSDFTGLPNFDLFLLHRFFFTGVGALGILLTAHFFKRLPQARILRKLSLGVTLLLLPLIGFSVNEYWQNYASEESLRKEVLDLNASHRGFQTLTPISYNIELQHKANMVEAVTRFRFKNENKTPISDYLFTLNPGFNISEIYRNSDKIKFERKGQIVLLKDQTPLNPGEIDSLTFKYRGVPKRAAQYLDILPDEFRKNATWEWIFRIDREFSFVTPKYLLLTPENNWYPASQLPVDLELPQQGLRNFADFHLKIHTLPGLTAISQGAVDTINTDIYSFSPEQKLPGISIVAGDYVKKTVNVYNTDFSIYHHPKHDFFSEKFNAIDTLIVEEISDIRDRYELNLNFDYPFKRFSVIEVPIQFYAFDRLWTRQNEHQQPEQLLIPEKGFFMSGFESFAGGGGRNRRHGRGRENAVQSEADKQVQSFQRIVKSNFVEQVRMRRSMHGMKYVIFPNFYSFVYDFRSAKWPIFNTALEAFLYHQSTTNVTRVRRFRQALSEDEEANQILLRHSFAEMLQDTVGAKYLPNIVKRKGAYLFYLINDRLQYEKMSDLLPDYLEPNAFSTITAEEFISSLETEYQLDLHSAIDAWYFQQKMPSFQLSNFRYYQVVDEDRARYQILFEIENQDSIDGIIECSAQFSRRGRMGMRGNPDAAAYSEIFVIDKHAGGEIGVVLDDEPRRFFVNTLISRNLPVTQEFEVAKPEMKQDVTAFSGVRPLSKSPQRRKEVEVIVDNEDPGFILPEQTGRSLVKTMLYAGQKDSLNPYVQFRTWDPPSIWKSVINSGFYGDFVHSGYYIGRGEGKKKVRWEGMLPENGVYDVYFYFPSEVFPRWMRRHGMLSSSFEYNFRVAHADGNEPVRVEISPKENGWVYVGSYYFKAGKNTVELSDKSTRPMIIADAVKWVKE